MCLLWKNCILKIFKKSPIFTIWKNSSRKFILFCKHRWSHWCNKFLSHLKHCHIFFTLMVWSLSFSQTFESQHKCWSLLLCSCWDVERLIFHMKSLSKPHSTLFFMPTFLYMIAQLCDNNRTLFLPSF